MNVIFETHAHYEDEAFDEDRDDLIKSLPESGIGYVVNVGSSIATCHRTVELIKHYDYMYGALGIHPGEIHEVTDDDMKWIETEAKTNPKIVSVGEIGLDYYWMESSKEEQKKFFKAQIELAKKLDMPIIVHDRDAHGDTLDIFRETKPKGVVHCFSGSKEMAREIIKLGMYIGLNGVVTFNNARKSLEVAKEIPIERLVLETDCPYLAPTPMRGKRNDSHYIPYIAEKIGSLLDMDAQELLDITNENAKRLYNL